MARSSAAPTKGCPFYLAEHSGKIIPRGNEYFWRKDGTRFAVSYTSVPILHEGVLRGALVTFTDLTERNALEAAVELERARSIHSSKLASLGEMAAGIAHEINNPLAIISGTIWQISKASADPLKLKKKVDVIQRSCERITKIVKGLRKFSRSGDRAPFAVGSLAAILNEALVLTSAKIKRHDTAISVEANVAGNIHCDEVEIEQVLINLLNNAVDAVRDLPEKWVKVTLREDEKTIRRPSAWSNDASRTPRGGKRNVPGAGSAPGTRMLLSNCRAVDASLSSSRSRPACCGTRRSSMAASFQAVRRGNRSRLGSISQQALSPLLQVMHTPSFVHSQVQMPKARLHWQTADAVERAAATAHSVGQHLAQVLERAARNLIVTGALEFSGLACALLDLHRATRHDAPVAGSWRGWTSLARQSLKCPNAVSSRAGALSRIALLIAQILSL